MRIINSRDIMETIEMLTAENLDVRTVTMGISLLDCIDPDPKKACGALGLLVGDLTALVRVTTSIVAGSESDCNCFSYN